MAEQIALSSDAESQAEQAENLSAFSGLKLLHVKREITTILGLIGGHGIFDEYTLHDISHVNAMLDTIAWLVSEDSQAAMTPADWLMLVLSVYFHDIGMLVTPDEFECRGESAFPRYRDELFGGRHGLDYRAKVEALGPGDSERFLYQEFVRNHHAERARAWITGTAAEHLGITHNAMGVVSQLLDPLDRQFRKDLGLVCASHHLDDLEDLDKYKVRRSYGQNSGEVCNLQFCAILLRAADLLHITQDRTPSVAFKLINPTDPVSQEEWAKQRAVRRVCPKIGIDHDGIPDNTAARDTIEVHAFFAEPKGFFGLTAYLRYAQSQLEKCHHWVEVARRQEATPYTFPWCCIDDSNIEAEHFLPRAFSFQLDQPRILELLVGHTLYNNTDVVLRELVQNSLDAVRLQRLLDAQQVPHPASGEVKVFWDSITRALIVEDNGTGMSQEIIERHLLNVGASYYQDDCFKKDFPTFSPISRFGIGILSTFMVSDEVEILTCHPADEQARQLSIRSVHGRYLIRLIDKGAAEMRDIAPHGTRVVVKLRPSSRIGDVLQSARKWIVLPGDGIRVTVTVDQDEPVEVGYRTLTEAMQQKSEGNGTSGFVRRYVQKSEGEGIEIRETTVGSVSIAYAVQWSEKLGLWRFVGARGTDRLGTCIEGIRVEPGTPGYDSHVILAMANVHGRDAPKTTVSRGGFETTAEFEQMLRCIFQTYSDHILTECAELQKRRPYSLTWATEEGNRLASTLVPNEGRRTDSLQESVFDEVFDRLPVLLVESKGSRRCVSLIDLGNEASVWTIECGLYRWAERLLREVPKSLSLGSVTQALTGNTFLLPHDSFLCLGGALRYFERRALRAREIDRVVVDKVNRRVDLRWTRKEGNPKWLRWDGEAFEFSCQIGTSERYPHPHAVFFVPLRDVQFSGLSGEVAVKVLDVLVLNSESPIVKYVVETAKSYGEVQSDQQKQAVNRACQAFRACMRMGGNYFDKVISDKGEFIGGEQLEISKWPPRELEAISAAADITNWQIYSPLDWMREQSD